MFGAAGNAYASIAVPDTGVSRVLARERAAQIRHLRYAFDAAIGPAADTLAGSVVISFDLARPAPVVLDYRPQGAGRARAWRVNGRAVDVAPAGEHVVLAARHMRGGANEVRVEFTAAISTAGAALTRYVDKIDDARYVYSLFVPADASSVFPCFDQPDLKAAWSLALTLPAGWNAIGNGALVRSRATGAGVRHAFAPTKPLPTYLFAFAAGPFAALTEPGHDDGAKLFVRRSQLARAQSEAADLLRLSRESNTFFASYFGHPHPFGKHDLVLVPEFPYGGMEHAGAVFLREEAMLFRAPPTAADRLRRANTILHENSHQWFGNLVTMRWFDDLWLKEGFANFAAARAIEALLPEFDAWNALRAAKLSAYRTDATAGTTAIYQSLANLADAKSVYGAIVYTKAPAVLRQAETYLGREVFERAVRRLVREHAYGNAEWSDLVRAFEAESGRDLAAWADVWVKRRGMATVRVARPVRVGEPYMVTQTPVLAEGGVWPMRFEIGFIDEAGVMRRQSVLLEGASTSFEGPAGGVPAIIIPNTGDLGYGRFLLDETSARNILARPQLVTDNLTRALTIDALWERVRDAELAPAEFLRFAIAQLPVERDAITYAGLLARMAHAFRAWLSDAQKATLAPAIEAALIERMNAAATRGERLQAMRALADCAYSESGLATLAALLDGNGLDGDAALAPRDRFAMIERLLVRDHAGAVARLAAETSRKAGEDTVPYAFAAGAAAADAATKARYVERFFIDTALAEDWIAEALGPLNAIEHGAMTAPLLDRALDALPSLKARHKIFFVGNWLAAFIGGQDSEAALAIVRRYAARENLDADLRLKVLEYADGLVRTIRIRARFAR